MKSDVVILTAEDDDGHFLLIKKNLRREGISNKIIRFANGLELWKFLTQKGDGPVRKENKSYLLLLDIRMPKIDGIEVLRRIKADPLLKKIPVIMITTTSNPEDVEICHNLGCAMYVVKPVEYETFVEAIRKVGMFLSIVEIPQIRQTAKETV